MNTTENTTAPLTAVAYLEPNERGEFGVDIITHHDEFDDTFDFTPLDAPLATEDEFTAWLAENGYASVGEIVREDAIADAGAGMSAEVIARG